MPRGRMLNKKISLNKTLPKVSLYSRFLFSWCIPHLDSGGKMHASPAIIKGVVVPYCDDFTEKRIQKCLDELSKTPLVLIYGDEIKYMKFMGFNEEQTINPGRESASDIPEPTEEEIKQKSNILLEQRRSNAGQTPFKDKLSKDKLSISKDETAEPHSLSVWIKKNCPSVSKLENQLTNDDCNRLLAEFPTDVVKDILLAMDNYKQLTKKYKSVNLTARNWLKRKNETPGQTIKVYSYQDLLFKHKESYYPGSKQDPISNNYVAVDIEGKPMYVYKNQFDEKKFKRFRGKK